MKIWLSTLFFFMTASVMAASPLSSRYVPGELIIKYKSKLSADAQKNSIEREGGRRLKRLNTRGFNHVRVDKKKNLEAVIAEFKKDPDVEFVQPNYIYKISATPNDTRYGQLWGLKNTAQTITSPGGPNAPSATANPGTAGKDMDLEKAWNTVTDCSSVVVAVLDTGINYNHEDLADNMWDGGVAYPNHGWDFIDNNNNPLDQNGHGTHVAGTIGAVGNNSKGTTGVCWKVKLMAVRVLDATGSGTTAGIIQGIDFAVARGAKILNMSLGGSSFDAAYSTSVTNARDAGAMVVAAAGNDSANNDNVATPSYPCNFTQANVLCVAALAQDYSLASFSNFGTTSVDVGAPGVNIVSTWPGTHSTVSDALTAGWTMTTTTANNWGYRSLSFSGTPRATLANPSGYTRTSAQLYDNNTDARIYKNFDLSGKNVAILNFTFMVDVDSGDKVSLNTLLGGGDPTTAGVELDYFEGITTNGFAYPLSYDVTPYISGNTSFGFSILTDGTGQNFGTNISRLYFETLTYNNTTYNVISGTSMATPHVAGLAAMLFAYNPSFGYADVINAIKNGGIAVSSLTLKTATGKAASATGALSYIAAPTGGAAVKLP